MKPPVDIANLEPPIKFYNGEVSLRFDRENWHWYNVTSGTPVRVSGVTGVCGIVDKSMYLVPWACKMMYVKILKTFPAANDRNLSLPWDEFDSIICEAKGAHKERLDEAGDIGGAAHKWIEDTVRNAITFNDGVVEKMNDTAPVDERSVSCGNAAFDWMQKHNARFICTERVVYSREYNYAGTTDGLALVDSCSDPTCCRRLFLDELSLVDWKSSNQLRLDYLFQTAAYMHAIMEEFPDQEIKSRWILRLGKEDGKFEAWYETDIQSDFDAYLACLALQRIHRAIELRMSEQKKLKTFKKRAAAKEVKEKIKFENKAAKAAEKARKKQLALGI